MRRLIINADDFGLTSGVNRAIAETHQHGVVTSATLMANGPAFAQATALAKTAPSLHVGCHIVFLDGSPILPPSEVLSLLDRTKDCPRFPHGLTGFAVRALTGRIDPQQIEAEAVAQIRKIQSAGIFVSHFDTHKHTHIFPAVLRPLLRAAVACGVRALRNPFPPLGTIPLAVLLSRPTLWKRSAQLKFLRRFASQFRRAVHEAGLFTSDGTLGVAQTGTLDEHLFQLIAKRLPEGTWEFVCHPGYNDAELQAAPTRLKASRMRELQVLTSPAVKHILEIQGIELISFRDLAAEPHRTRT